MDLIICRIVAGLVVIGLIALLVYFWRHPGGSPWSREDDLDRGEYFRSED